MIDQDDGCGKLVERSSFTRYGDYQVNTHNLRCGEKTGRRVYCIKCKEKKK